MFGQATQPGVQLMKQTHVALAVFVLLLSGARGYCAFGISPPAEFGFDKLPPYAYLRGGSAATADPAVGRVVLTNDSGYDVLGMFVRVEGEDDLKLTLTAARGPGPEAKLGVICLGVDLANKVDSRVQANIGWNRRLKPDAYGDETFLLSREKIGSLSQVVFILVYRCNREGVLRIAKARLERVRSPDAGPPADHARTTLESADWRVVVEPRFGGRCSALAAKRHGCDFVFDWSLKADEKTGAEKATGGAFCGHMCGSYVSEQEHEPYSVLTREPDRLVMRYRNRHNLFAGLEETRTVSLCDAGRTVCLELAIVNRAAEDRALYYRLHDFLGTGSKNGLDSVYLTPTGDDRVAAVAAAPGGPGNLLYAPHQPWFALADLTRDVGLLARVEDAEVRQFYYWLGRPRLRTAETFFERVRLAPGASWQARLLLTAFSPSDPKLPEPLGNRLTTASIHAHLRRSGAEKLRTGLPLSAVMDLDWDEAAPHIGPVHPSDPLQGASGFTRCAGTLRAITLHGTPGEVVPFAFAVSSARGVDKARVGINGLAGAGGAIPASDIELRYVSRDGLGYLVRDWRLAKDGAPESIATIHNELRDSEALTPFSLAPGGTAFLWGRLRIPQGAAPGAAAGVCAVTVPGGAGAQFRISVNIHPFRLTTESRKVRGAFFRYQLRTGKPDEPAHRVTREQFVNCLQNMQELGYNGLTLYEGRREELHWILDRCVELGWRDALFVLIHPYAVDPAALHARYRDQGFRFRAWVIDEPSRYAAVPTALRRYGVLAPRWPKQCIFTPNTPFGVALADALPGLVPILAHLGTAPYIIQVTREYAAAGREVYWYGMPFGAPSVVKRLLRGVCLWKEPAHGMLDWGEDSASTKPGSALAGFVGAEIVPTLARENVRTGYCDLLYLQTLEQAVKSAAPDSPATKDAERFLAWVRSRFDYVFDSEATRFTQTYLDQIRLAAARHTAAVTGKTTARE